PPQPGQPYQAQPPYPGQQPYQEQPPYQGQQPYQGQPPYQAQPPYQQPPYQGQQPYQGQPPYQEAPPYQGQAYQPPYQQDAGAAYPPVYDAQSEQPPGHGMGVASLVLGIIALVLTWIPWVNIVAIAMSVIGLILAITARKKNAAVGAPSGVATGGLICSIIALALSVLSFVTCTLCLTAIGSGVGSLPDFWDY
ncbi:MAG: DUF4190 domain-containing protein, partial [Oscillospiraceae bacterium]|nr:DUF4190 domain-containing protein [Oscillospiraceae bacterium]